jgi:hypothetical protein
MQALIGSFLHHHSLLYVVCLVHVHRCDRTEFQLISVQKQKLYTTFLVVFLLACEGMKCSKSRFHVGLSRVINSVSAQQCSRWRWASDAVPISKELLLTFLLFQFDHGYGIWVSYFSLIMAMEFGSLLFQLIMPSGIPVCKKASKTQLLQQFWKCYGNRGRIDWSAQRLGKTRYKNAINMKSWGQSFLPFLVFFQTFDWIPSQAAMELGNCPVTCQRRMIW